MGGTVRAGGPTTRDKWAAGEPGRMGTENREPGAAPPGQCRGVPASVKIRFPICRWTHIRIGLTVA